MKLTLKYSSFLFTNDVSLVKNVPQEVDAAKLSNKDKIIINSYIRSGAIESSAGEFPVDLEEVVEAIVEAPVAKPEPVLVEVKAEEVVAVESILDAPAEEAQVEEPVKKKATAKKATAKK